MSVFHPSALSRVAPKITSKSFLPSLWTCKNNRRVSLRSVFRNDDVHTRVFVRLYAAVPYLIPQASLLQCTTLYLTLGTILTWFAYVSLWYVVRVGTRNDGGARTGLLL